MTTDINLKSKLSQNLYCIRGIAIVLVVVGHVIGYNRDYGMRHFYNSDLSALGWLCDFINTFHMSVFFIASGVAFAVFSNKNTGYLKFFKSKVEKLVIPLICWSPIYFVFQSLSKGQQFSLLDIIKSAIYPYEIFWFIHALIFATVLSFICFKLFKSQLTYLMISIILFIACLKIENMYLYWHWNIFYALGVFLSNYLSRINLELKSMRLITIFLIEFLCISVMLITKSFMPFHDAIDFSRLINGVVGFLFMYILVESGDERIINNKIRNLIHSGLKSFAYLGSLSIIIYLFHGYFTRGTIIILTKSFGIPEKSLYFMLVCSMGILGPVIIYNLLQPRSKIFIYSVGGAKG